MLRLLVQSLILSIVSFISIGIIFITIFYGSFYKELEDSTIYRAHAEINSLMDYANTHPSDKDWQQKLADMESYSPYTFTITPLNQFNDLDSDKKQQLLMRNIFIKIDRQDYFNLIGHIYLLVNHDNVICLTTKLTENYLGQNNSFSTYVTIISIIIVVISTWLSFHWSELNKVVRIAEKISQGDFSARVNLKKFASTYMIGEKINRMAAYLEELQRGQRELIHSVSHELRTPITRLEFGLEILKEDVVPHKAQQRITALLQDINELNELVNELLQLAAVGQQYTTDLKKFDLAKLLNACIQSFEYQENNIEKQFVTSIPNNLGFYLADYRLLERALRNLLNNAEKYSKTKVQLSAKKYPNGSYLIIIEDDGPGIPEHLRLQIFKPFYRIENSSDKKVHGYGIGLAMVQKIITIHYGKIEVEQSYLGGAKFIVSLPPIQTIVQHDSALKTKY